MRLIILIIVYLCINFSLYSQYNASALLNNSLKVEAYQQLIGEVSYYNSKSPSIYNEKRNCIYGNCNNGESAIAITFKGGLYYKEKVMKALYIAGNFANGKIEGQGYIFHTYDKKSKKTLQKLLKKGKFQEAWNIDNVRPKISGIFNANTIIKGKYVSYYDYFVPYLREGTDSKYIYNGMFYNEEFQGNLYINNKNVLASDFNNIDKITFITNKNYPDENKYTIKAEKEYPTIKRFLKDGNNENINYLFDKHYILKGLGVSIEETASNDWKINISSGYSHNYALKIDTVIKKPKGQIKTINELKMFANYDSNNNANGFVSMVSKSGATYTGFMKEGKYHGPGFYMSSDGIWIGRFYNNSMEEGIVISIRRVKHVNTEILDDSRVFHNFTNSLYKPRIDKKFTRPKVFYAEVKNKKYTRKGLVTSSITNIATRKYSGEIDGFGVPNGDAIVDGKKGYYKNGFYEGPTRKEQQAIAKQNEEEKAYWLTQSSCGLKGEWVSLSELVNHRGKVVCSKNGLSAFGWVHPGAANWQTAVNSINNKPEERQRYSLNLMFPNVTPGDIYFKRNIDDIEFKGNSVFVVDTAIENYYNPCGLCSGSGQLRIMSEQENTSPVTARYTYYVINDPLGGYMIQKAIRHKREKDLDKYGRNGLYYSDKKKVPCLQCLGMGIIFK
ncbi:hypothetical protein N1F78_13685 [Seonamhaeicola sp. MEBiC1930]|uniref:hypothetical protein n=1 Tax=Seonamhaeicola sp. MEBiC01930 TaxID=2976768 RepID=UPI00324B6060